MRSLTLFTFLLTAVPNRAQSAAYYLVRSYVASSHQLDRPVSDVWSFEEALTDTWSQSQAPTTAFIFFERIFSVVSTWSLDLLQQGLQTRCCVLQIFLKITQSESKQLPNDHSKQLKKIFQLDKQQAQATTTNNILTHRAAKAAVVVALECI